MGNGQGYSIRDVLVTVKQVTGADFDVVEAPRRDGDPARLVADSKLLQAELSWRPTYPDLETIIQHAWKWEQKLSR